jgi:flagellar biosynthetic protein FlhB
MANKDPSRTEPATAKRIGEARQDGNILKSDEILSGLMILGGVLLCFYTIPQTYAVFSDIFRQILGVDCRVPWDDEMIKHGAYVALKVAAALLAPVCFALCLFALMIMRYQIGPYFSLKVLHWKFDEFNPVNGIKSLMPNKHNAVVLGFNLLKVSVVALFVYFAIRDDMSRMADLPAIPFLEAILWLVKRLIVMIFKILSLVMIIAVIDYFYRKHKYFEDLMMTKQEVKDEMKNAEGDPRVKGKIRQKMRELFKMRMMASVPRASVIITNPTHVSVALKYELGDFAPQVVAKGLRKKALAIRKIARENGVPIIEAPPLARSLYRNCQIGQFIPSEFYSAVAAILARLHRDGKRKFDRRKKAA